MLDKMPLTILGLCT